MSINKKLAQLLGMADELNERIILAGTKVLIAQYKRALEDTINEISKIFRKYGDQVTIDQMMQWNRLRNLESLFLAHINKLNGESYDAILGNIKDGFQQSYASTGFALEKSLQVNLGFSVLDENVLMAAAINPMSKVKWPDANKANLQDLFGGVRNEMVLGLQEGKGYAMTAKAITDQYNIGINKALRIIWTETHRVQQVGRNMGYDTAAGYADEVGMNVEKAWLATLDSRTRPNHGAMEDVRPDEEGKFLFTTMDGNQILVDGPGVTGTTDDIHCRCTLQMKFLDIPNRVRRAADTGNVIPWQSYSQYYQKKFAA